MRWFSGPLSMALNAPRPGGDLPFLYSHDAHCDVVHVPSDEFLQAERRSSGGTKVSTYQLRTPCSFAHQLSLILYEAASSPSHFHTSSVGLQRTGRSRGKQEQH